MLIERILQEYDAQAAARRPTTGNPTGSRFGACAAQSQMLRYPELAPAEPLRARTMIAFEDGDAREAWWGALIERLFPAASGLTQAPFFLAVPVPPEEAEALSRLIRAGRVWGREWPGFAPPAVALGADGRVKVRVGTEVAGGRALPGFVLDPGAGLLWAPTVVDRVVRLDGLGGGLAVVEKKAMSRAGFARVLRADPGYALRAQLAGEAAATGLTAILLAYCKDTGHLAEVVYHRAPGEDAGRSRVDLVLPSGGRETYFVRAPGAAPEAVDGTPYTLPPWETVFGAEVWTPQGDAALLQQIRERVRRVLLVQPGAWHREYGPDFRCPRCGGAGTRICGACKGTGRTPTGKAHKPCAGKGRAGCGRCHGAGRLEEGRLKRFPCGYCPVWNTCYPMAELRFERGGVGGSRPVYTIPRAAFEASGILVFPPEAPPPPEPEGPEEDGEAAAGE